MGVSLGQGEWSVRTCVLKTEPKPLDPKILIFWGFYASYLRRRESYGEHFCLFLRPAELWHELNEDDATRSLIPVFLLADYSHHICYPPSDPSSSPSTPSVHVRSQKFSVREASSRRSTGSRRRRRPPKKPSKNPCHLRRIQRLHSFSRQHSLYHL